MAGLSRSPKSQPLHADHPFPGSDGLIYKATGADELREAVQVVDDVVGTGENGGNGVDGCGGHGSKIHPPSRSSSTFTIRISRTESRRPNLGTDGMQIAIPLVFSWLAIALCLAAFVQLRARGVDVPARVRRSAGLAAAALGCVIALLAAQGRLL